MADPTSPAAPTPNQAAAHEFLTELRTRISTQPLPYQYGVEARALESLWELFALARAAMKAHPGCREFAQVATRTLNLHVRPVTAKWHKAHGEGRLSSRDGADAFRGELASLQRTLRRFAAELHEMAYGERADDPLTPDANLASDLAKILAPVPFGITADTLIPDPAAINASEAGAVHSRRALRNIGTAAYTNAVGLALSGGGIRSATFCLGVVQVLAQRGVFKDVDFLSTVSGGGYTGAFLATRLGGGEPLDSVASPDGPDPDAIRYLRQHAKYLAAVELKQQWSMVTAAVAGMLLNWCAPLLVVALAALGAIGYAGQTWRIPWLFALQVSAAITGACLLAYGVGLRVTHAAARWTGWILAASSAIAVAVSAGWLLEEGYRFVVHRTSWRMSMLSTGVIVTIPAILRFMPIAEKPIVRTLVLEAVLFLCALVIPIGAVGVLYGLTYAGSHPPLAWRILLGLIAVLAVTAVFVLNINQTGLHRLYRDRLGRAFVQRDENDDAPVLLQDINAANTAPYLLINTTLNVPGSTHAALRERKSDFFLFSKGWCGSPVVGYFRTQDWRANHKVPDLATAMAISGAAVAPNMGLGSKPALRSLLAFLNVRLGFWIVRPGAKTVFKVPGFLCLLREMTGFGMAERHAWLNLSDGGHVENMGVYELLRRRCKYIVCIDGEADPQYGFQGLMTVVRHAQIDFGVRIALRLDDIRPPAGGSSQTHAVLGRVHYPDGAQGLILYLKLSMTGNEPELLRRYRLSHPEFPHQSTLDQFFDEEQFEAYRRLGVHVADGLFTPGLVGAVTPNDLPRWFRQLALNLLDPSLT